MAELWHYTREGRPQGPVATAEIQQMARKGELLPSDLVWRQGMPEWIEAANAPGIFTEPAAVPPSAVAAHGGIPMATMRTASTQALAAADEKPKALQPLRRAERRDGDGGAKRTDRHWDAAGDPKITVRRPRRDRSLQMIILSVGLLVGGGLLLLVLVLGLFFMVLAR